MKLALRSFAYAIWTLFCVIIFLAGWAMIANPQLGPQVPTIGIVFVIVGFVGALVGGWSWWEEVWKRRD